MAEAKLAKRIERVVGSALAMANRFQRYTPETEYRTVPLEVKEDETLKRLKEAWKACSHTGNPEKDYPKMLKIVKKLEYSAKDVENFNIALAGFQSEKMCSSKAGLFLSALINNCKDSDFVIHTNHLVESISYLGFKNTKNITVKGNTGDVVGINMKGGTITVKGNAGKEGGWGMKGGTITVEGDAGELVGFGMEGGSIRLEGKYVHIAENIKHGSIFHKGKLIVDK
ncbi:hypothetical protein H0O00_03240 [Candidatus Micrarchaeota archaeon]|nr:hypothetical protein [Candidatus Micrarchaeota archaeon]